MISGDELRALFSPYQLAQYSLVLTIACIVLAVSSLGKCAALSIAAFVAGLVLHVVGGWLGRCPSCEKFWYSPAKFGDDGVFERLFRKGPPWPMRHCTQCSADLDELVFPN